MSKAKRRALYAEKLREALHERWAREQQESRKGGKTETRKDFHRTL